MLFRSDEFSVYKQDMEGYLAEIAGIYNHYITITESLFTQYETQFGERYNTFESTLNGWDAELLKAYTDFMAKITLFEADAENDFNIWFESMKEKLGGDIAGSLQIQIDGLTGEVAQLRQQATENSTAVTETLKELDRRLTLVENGWNINYKHEAVLGLCYMGGAYMSQQHERTEETAVLGFAYVGNAYLANTF